MNVVWRVSSRVVNVWCVKGRVSRWDTMLMNRTRMEQYKATSTSRLKQSLHIAVRRSSPWQTSSIYETILARKFWFPFSNKTLSFIDKSVFCSYPAFCRNPFLCFSHQCIITKYPSRPWILGLLVFMDLCSWSSKEQMADLTPPSQWSKPFITSQTLVYHQTLKELGD